MNEGNGIGDLERRFTEAVAWLEDELRQLRSTLPFSHAEVRDFSNLSGFDKSGFPHYVWSKQLVHDSDHAGEVWRATIQLSYREPEDFTAGRSVRVESRAEVFSKGAESRVDHRAEVSIALGEPIEPEARRAWDRARTTLARQLGAPPHQSD